MELPVRKDIIHAALQEYSITQMSQASIRETVGVIKFIEAATGVRFLRMDMGVPGLPTPDIAVKAEIKALKQGLSASYGQIDGIPSLKEEATRFVKNFLDVDVSEKSCIVTVGSMMGSMIAFMVAAKRDIAREGVLFFDPGFPVQKRQAMVMNLPIFTLEVLDNRGAKLRPALEKMCSENPVSLIIYSNPNNPTWTCLSEEELRIIGETADKYSIVVVEDLAYFGMDFRKDFGQPGKAPYQPTIAKYTNNYLLLISSSKVFSYAGQRVGLMVISDSLFQQEFPDLLEIGYNIRMGPALIMDGVYVLSAGAGHTAQHGLAAVLKAVNDGDYSFLEPLQVYRERAKSMKRIFSKHGFSLVFDRDGKDILADGFYFTVNHKAFNAEQLCLQFLRFGLGAVSLSISGCTHTSGMRICVSQIHENDFNELDKRLEMIDKRCE